MTPNPRADRARFVAAGANGWLKVRSKDGRKFYGVPSQSQPGRYFLTDTRTCDCPSYRWTGDCKHRQAVVLWVARVRAQQARQEATA
jgi:hypothetical protein